MNVEYESPYAFKSAPTVMGYPVKGIVTLCGSHRFSNTFDYIAQELGIHYWVVLRPAFWKDAHTLDNPNSKVALDIVHLAKISISESIIVINKHFPTPDIDNEYTYIGQSTKREIEYARENYRKIIWLEVTPEMIDNGTFQFNDLTYKEWQATYNH